MSRSKACIDATAALEVVLKRFQRLFVFGLPRFTVYFFLRLPPPRDW